MSLTATEPLAAANAYAANPAKPTEKSRRRKDFAGGVPVVLTDGEEWFFFKPLVRMGKRSVRGGLCVVIDPTPDDTYAELDERFRRLTGSESFSLNEFNDALLDIGVALLLRNYSLSEDEVFQLVRIAPAMDMERDDPVGSEIRAALLDLSQGRGPKAPSGTRSLP